MKKGFFILLLSSLMATLLSAQTITTKTKADKLKSEIEALEKQEMRLLNEDSDILRKYVGKNEKNLEKEIKKLRKEETKLSKKVEIMETYKKHKLVYSKKATQKVNIKKKKRIKIYTKRRYYKGRKVSEHINYKRTKYATRDYYPTYSKDLSINYKIQRKRENILKDTL